MRIAIARDGDLIQTIKQYAPIKDKGEVAHFLAELESMKNDLQEIWEEMDHKDTELSMSYDVDDDGTGTDNEKESGR